MILDNKLGLNTEPAQHQLPQLDRTLFRNLQSVSDGDNSQAANVTSNFS